MKSIVYKAFWNYEKEEEWLNNMSVKGLALTDYFWIRYVFQDCAPGEYIYRIEMLEHKPSTPEGRKYIEFMEETGAEHVSSYLWWAYFRKKAEDGPFDIYSDIDSRIKHYLRIIRMFAIIGALNLAAWIMNIAVGLINLCRFDSVSVNLWMPFVNLCLAIALGGICLKFFRKVKMLKKEKSIHQ